LLQCPFPVWNNSRGSRLFRLLFSPFLRKLPFLFSPVAAWAAPFPLLLKHEPWFSGPMFIRSSFFPLSYGNCFLEGCGRLLPPQLIGRTVGVDTPPSRTAISPFLTQWSISPFFLSFTSAAFSEGSRLHLACGDFFLPANYERDFFSLAASF